MYALLHLIRRTSNLRPLALFLLAQLRCERGPEVLRAHDLANLQVRVVARMRVRRAFGPLHRFFLRLALPDPKARDQLLGLRKRAIDGGALVAVEIDARTLG